ncbi:MFS transporter [Paenisporosarcina sp. TG20]|uniref:MFS transporter n=1 Tax=Paenisporosarcina sp. TG20 TaxID=1211706 RepID=UPI00037DD86D|nr:MFS transporter [Paenisporosarcina sp. TG20]
MVNQVGSLIGPALGGFAIAFFTAPGTLLINVIFFFIAALLYMLIPEEVYHRDMERVAQEKVEMNIKEKWKKFIHETMIGIKFIVSYRILIVIACITLFFNFAYAPLESAFPVFVDRILRAGPEVLGIMWSIFAVGSLTGSVLWTKLSIKISYSYSLGSVIILWGLIPLLLSITVEVKFVYLLMLLGGVVYAPYNIVAPTIRQKLVPNKIRGRVFGVYGLISGIGFPIGVYLGGLLTEQLGVLVTVSGSGILTIIVGIFVLFSKSLRFNDTEQLAINNEDVPDS